MSVDWNACDSCGDSRYEEYVGHCIECGSSVCTACVVNDDIDDNYAHRYGYRFDSSNPELMNRYIKDGFDLYKKDGTPYYEDDDIIDDSGIDEKYCPFCSGNQINTEELYDFIVEKYNIDVEKEWKELKNK